MPIPLKILFLFKISFQIKKKLIKTYRSVHVIPKEYTFFLNKNLIKKYKVEKKSLKKKNYQPSDLSDRGSLIN